TSGSVTGSPIYGAYTGNDSNTGLTQTPSGAFLTMQGGFDVIRRSVMFNGYAVTMQLANGTFASAGDGLTIGSSWVGSGTFTVNGNSTLPSNVLLSTVGYSMHALGPLPGGLFVSNLQMTSSGAGCLASSSYSDF